MLARYFCSDVVGCAKCKFLANLIFSLDLNATDKPSDFMKVPTPPQTPEISETPMPVNGSIETPVSSVREEVKETNDRSPVSTPDVSAVAKSVKTLEDFVR